MLIPEVRILNPASAEIRSRYVRRFPLLIILLHLLLSAFLLTTLVVRVEQPDRCICVSGNTKF